MPFSVLISLYAKERPSNLRECFQSLAQQTVRADEIILVEDGPLTPALTAVVAEIKAKMPEIKEIALPQNKGLGNALATGLPYCTHEIVARMDTDDIAKPTRFERQLAVMQQMPEISVVGSWIDEFIDTTDNTTAMRVVPEKHEEIEEFSYKRNPMNHPTVMFRKSHVLEVGSYNHFPLFEDYALWVRMIMGGYRFYNIQESLLWFRTSKDFYHRRGGIKYVATEIAFQNYLLTLSYISFGRVVRNLAVRIAARLTPNFIRSIIYRKMLRREKRA